MLHWLVNGRVLDPGREGGESRVTASQRIAGYLFQVTVMGKNKDSILGPFPLEIVDKWWPFGEIMVKFKS